MNRASTKGRFIALFLVLACFVLGAWYRIAYLSQPNGTGNEDLAPHSLKSLPKENAQSGNTDTPLLGSDLDGANPASAEADLKKLEAELTE